MRTSHLAIRRRIDETKSNITDKEFFGSKAFEAYLSDMAETSTKRYKKPISVRIDWDDSKDALIAFTDNNNIFMNTGNKISQSFPTRRLRADSLIGICAHEIGHILFSDFDCLSKYQKAFKSGIFYPETPQSLSLAEQGHLDEIKKIFKNNETYKLDIIVQIASNLANLIEDIYIEANMCYSFPGVYRTGILLNNTRVCEMTLSIKNQIKEGYKPISIIFNLLFQYARLGDINNPDGYNGEYLDALYDCMSYVDDGVYDSDPNMRLMAANMVFISLWPYVKTLIEKAEEDKSKNRTSDEETSRIISETLKEQMPSMSNAPTGGNKPSKEGIKQSKGKLNNAHKKVCKKVLPPKSQLLEKSEKQSSNENESKTNQYQPLFNDNEAETKETSAQQVSDHETGRLAYEETQEFSHGVNGGFSRNSSYMGAGYDSSAEDIEKMLEKMASEAVTQTMEKEFCKELQTEANRISYGNAHKGIYVNINRMSVVDEHYIESYNRIAPPLLALSKRLQKQVSAVLKDKREGGKQTGLLLGKRFSARDTMRNDCRMFYNNRLLAEPMELSVAVLNDESGSMSSNNRATIARAASIVVYDFCKSLNIPIAIYGHTTRGSNAELYAHAEFNSIDKKDKYRLMDISSRDCNRDGAALRFVAERLIKRPETMKILILISDGQPYCGNYHGKAAEEDLRGIKKEYERKGIILFAAAIGDDKPNVERIYGSGFLDVTDINKLPVNLATLISNHIKGGN